MIQAGGQLQDTTLYSRALCRWMRLHVYLPPGYPSERRYPVVYLLHPWGADEHFWTAQLAFLQAADHLIAAGAISPFIAAMPQGDKSFFINAANPRGDFEMIVRLDPEHYQGALEGCGDYGDYLLDDVCEFVEQRYPVRAGRMERAIAGIGMGATGAAILAFTHPDYFCAVGIHSPVMFSDERPGPPWIFGFGDAAAFARRDPAQLAANLTPGDGLRVFLDCAAHEPEITDHAADLHYALEKKSLPHAYLITPGLNDALYWRGMLASYLGFYAAGW